MRVPQSPQGTSLSPCIPCSPLQCHGDAPSDLTGFLFLPGGGVGGKDPLRSILSPGLASLLWPTLRISLSPFCSQPCPSTSSLATGGEFRKCKSDSTASLILHCPLPTGEEPVIQGLDCHWLTSQAPLSSPKVQPHLLPFKPSLPSLLLNLGQPLACSARQAARFLKNWPLGNFCG